MIPTSHSSAYAQRHSNPRWIPHRVIEQNPNTKWLYTLVTPPLTQLRGCLRTSCIEPNLSARTPLSKLLQSICLCPNSSVWLNWSRGRIVSQHIQNHQIIHSGDRQEELQTKHASSETSSQRWLLQLLPQSPKPHPGLLNYQPNLSPMLLKLTWWRQNNYQTSETRFVNCWIKTSSACK